MKLMFTQLNGESANMTWQLPRNNVVIKVDQDQEGRIRCIVHELLHLEFSRLMERLFDTHLEEALVLALESSVHEYIKASPRRLNAWRKVIEEKLNASN